MGKRVIVSLPFPIWDQNIPDLQIRNILGRTSTPTERTQENLHELLGAMAADTGAELFDPRLSLCADKQCIYQIDGVSIYRDGSHLASSQLGLLRNDLRAIISRR
jgi:SGNH domain (fused to AT3 domains)